MIRLWFAVAVAGLVLGCGKKGGSSPQEWLAKAWKPVSGDFKHTAFTAEIPDVWLAGGVLDLERLIGHADMIGRNVEVAGLRIERRRLLVLGTQSGRAHVLGRHVLTVVLGRVLRNAYRSASLHIDARGPVHRRVILLGHEQHAVGAIQRVAEAVAVEVHHGLGRLAVHRDVGQDHLVDAVEVPLVVRRHLIDPPHRAGVDIAGPDRHGPLVVAGTLNRIPGRGVARAVVHRVLLRVVAVPAPGRAAADLPLVALPGLQR